MTAARAPIPSWLLADLTKIGVTFTLALAAGWALMQAGAPAPYLMGSLFGVWFGGALMRPLQPYLGVARWFHKPVVLGLGVLMCSMFSARAEAFVGAGQVLLPGNASFTLVRKSDQESE